MRVRVTTLKFSPGEQQSYCRDCKWSVSTENPGGKPRYHAESTGHKVDVYTEQAKLYLPVKSKGGGKA